jgi:hypothetical protein
MTRAWLLGLCLAGVLAGCVHQESYDRIVARNGRPTEFEQDDKTYTAYWGEGENRDWVKFDRNTQRILDSSENKKLKCRLLDLCGFTRD